MKKNGFTLIELLAVILILGIIALIAIPTVNKILEESRRGAFESTINNIERKVKETCTMEKIKDIKVTYKYVINNGKITPSLDINGDLPNGNIYVDNNCDVTYSLSNKNFVGTKNGKEEKIIIEKCSNGKCPEASILISKDTDKSNSYVGYYADVDSDGIIDGVIFADLITGAIGSGEWVNSNGTYKVPTISADSSKDYYISKKRYEGDFGTKQVITLKENTTGSDRFYIMALNDFNPGTYYYYYKQAYNNMTDFATYTSNNFGTGKTNTAKMIEKWDVSGYGSQTNAPYKDIWGEVKSEVANGWFIPSREEWAAFNNELSITDTNYTSFNLSNCYWISSQYGKSYAWRVNLTNGNIYSSLVSTNNYVRLAKNF